MDGVHFVNLSADGHFGGFHLLVILTSATLNLHVREFVSTPVFSSFGVLPGSRITGTHGNYV